LISYSEGKTIDDVESPNNERGGTTEAMDS
jgi:hypothetical protein